MKEMTTNEYGLKSMEDINLGDLRMSSKMLEKWGPVPMGKTIEYMFVGLLAKVFTQGVLKRHEEILLHCIL
jgi:hypothetical protein